MVAHMAALIIAPPGSSITSISALKGRTVGVLGGEVNAKIVDVLNNTYDLPRAESPCNEPGLDGSPAGTPIQGSRARCWWSSPLRRQIFVAGTGGFFRTGSEGATGSDRHKLRRSDSGGRTTPSRASMCRRARWASAAQPENDVTTPEPSLTWSPTRNSVPTSSQRLRRRS